MLPSKQAFPQLKLRDVNMVRMDLIKIMPSATVIKKLSDVIPLCNSDADAIEVGGITPKRREGNEEPRLWIKDYRDGYAVRDPDGDGTALSAFWRLLLAINSMGLPDCDIERCCAEAADMLKVTRAAKKELWWNLSSDAEGMAEMLATMRRLDVLNCVQTLCFNTGCPNLEPGNMFGYELDELERFFCGTLPILLEGYRGEVAVKNPSPYDLARLKKVCQIYHKSGIVDYDIRGNTVGICSLAQIETGRSVIAPNGGLGGYSGSPILPINRGQAVAANDFYNELGSKIKLVGCGGIRDAESALQYLTVGPRLRRLQIGAAYVVKTDRRLFGEIRVALAEMLERLAGSKWASGALADLYAPTNEPVA